MKIENLKELQKVIKACRLAGVLSIEVDGVKLTLQPQAPSKAALPIDFQQDPLATAQVPTYTPMHQETAQETVARIKEEMTDEQLLFYSAVGPTDHMVSEQ